MGVAEPDAPKGLAPKETSHPGNEGAASAAPSPSVSVPLFEDMADLGLGDLTSTHGPSGKVHDPITQVRPARQGSSRGRSSLTAIEAQRALSKAGVQVTRKVAVADTPSNWKVGLRQNENELFCPEERVLLHTPPSPVPVAVVGEFAHVQDADMLELLHGLAKRGFVTLNDRGDLVSITAKGEAVASSRLTEPDESAAAYAGHARIYAANVAVLAGGMDAKAYAQTILDVVGRGTDEGRKVALIGVSGMAASELVTRLEAGVNRPLYLQEVADHLRFSLRPEIRMEAEPYLVMLADAQIVSNHFENLSGAADPVAYATSVEAYREAANRPLSIGTLKRLSMSSLRALDDLGEASGRRAAEIASAVLGALQGGAEGAKIRGIAQLSAVLSPTLAVHAAANADEASLKAFVERLQMSRDATSDLLSMMTRPMLREMGGDERATSDRLLAMASYLGHDFNDAEQRVIMENIESVALHDGAYRTYIQQLVAEGIHDTHLRPGILLDAAGNFASQGAEKAMQEGDSPKAEANIRIMAMLANGATVGDLERACYAAHAISTNGLETEAQKDLAKVIEASLRATLVTVAGRAPSHRDRDEYLAALAEAYPRPGQYLTALRQALVGAGSIEEQAPYAATFAQMNLDAFVASTGLDGLRDIITVQALELAKQKSQSPKGGLEDGSDSMSVTEAFQGWDGAGLADLQGKAKGTPAMTSEGTGKRRLSKEEKSLSAFLAHLAAMKVEAQEDTPGPFARLGQGAMLVFQSPEGVDGEPSQAYGKEQIVRLLRQAKRLDQRTELVVASVSVDGKWGTILPMQNADIERLVKAATAVNSRSCQVVLIGSTVDVARAKAVRQAFLDRKLSVATMVISDEQAASVFAEATHEDKP